MALPVPVEMTATVGQILTAAEWNSNVRDGINFLANTPLFSGYQGTAQSVPNAAYTPISIDTTNIDTYTGHSNTTNNTRYTAPVAGTYRVTGSSAFSANTSGTRAIVISVNGSHGSAFNYTQVQMSAATTSSQIMQTSWPMSLSAGDYVEICAYQNSGAALSLSAFYSGMAIHWIHA